MSRSATIIAALVITLATKTFSETLCSLPIRIDGDGSSGSTVCLGDKVTFTCTASSLETTVLRWNDSTGFRSQNQFDSPVTFGPYKLSVISSNLSMPLTVKAVANVTTSLIGTAITCSESKNGRNYFNFVTGCVNLTRAVPPSELSATIANCTPNSVTLQWSDPRGSNYTLTSFPASSNCNGSCSADPSTRQYTFSGLQQGVTYVLGVRGANCGGIQQGPESIVNVTIPVLTPPNITVCLLYDGVTDQLQHLSMTWPSMPKQTLSGGVVQCSPLSHYTVKYTTSDGAGNFSVPLSNCTPNCSSIVNIDKLSTFYNVSVSGIGIPEAFKTGSINNILKVDIVNWTNQVTINCTFLPGLVGTSRCVVQFGTSPDYLPYISTSSQSGGSGQSLSVPLTINGAPVDPNTSYFYRVSLLTSNDIHQCVILKGSFCALGYLGTPSTKNCTCPGGNFGVKIPNGCACYNGITQGSVASVQCDSEYQPVGNRVLLCQKNATWGGERPKCTRKPVNGAGYNIHMGNLSCIVVLSFLVAFCLQFFNNAIA